MFGADHGETLDAAMRAQTVGEEKEEEEGEEGDSDQGEEKRRGKREIVRSHAQPWRSDRASGGDVRRRRQRSLPLIERVMKFTTQRIGL